MLINTTYRDSPMRTKSGAALPSTSSRTNGTIHLIVVPPKEEATFVTLGGRGRHFSLSHRGPRHLRMAPRHYRVDPKAGLPCHRHHVVLTNAYVEALSSLIGICPAPNFKANIALPSRKFACFPTNASVSGSKQALLRAEPAHLAWVALGLLGRTNARWHFRSLRHRLCSRIP